jgi:hypothetical protein
VGSTFLFVPPSRRLFARAASRLWCGVLVSVSRGIAALLRVLGFWWRGASARVQLLGFGG